MEFDTKTPLQQSLIDQACQYMPGGVNSPVRAFQDIDMQPLFIQSGLGAEILDTDNQCYIDYVCSFGANILGHAHPDICAVIQSVSQKGLSFGATHPYEIEHAKLITRLMPTIEQIRFVSSGTEATMSAVRLAKAYSGKSILLRFSGCYHGHADLFLHDAGSGALTFSASNTSCTDTLLAEYNNLEQVEQLFKRHGNHIGAVIIEPVSGNMNLVRAKKSFLLALRNLCDQYRSVLIFDEVMTGFRVALGGAQSLYDIEPDLTCLGKVIGGGLPVGAFGGRRDIMEQLSPAGPVYQAGTLSGHPLTMATGLTALQYLEKHDPYPTLQAHTQKLTQGMAEQAKSHHIPFYTDHIGGMFGFLFSTHQSLEHDQQIKQCDRTRFRQFYHHLIQGGLYFAPSPFEAAFLSVAHTNKIIDKTLLATEYAFNQIAHTA